MRPCGLADLPRVHEAHSGLMAAPGETGLSAGCVEQTGAIGQRHHATTLRASSPKDASERNRAGTPRFQRLKKSDFRFPVSAPQGPADTETHFLPRCATCNPPARRPQHRVLLVQRRNCASRRGRRVALLRGRRSSRVASAQHPMPLTVASRHIPSTVGPPGPEHPPPGPGVPIPRASAPTSARTLGSSSRTSVCGSIWTLSAAAEIGAKALALIAPHLAAATAAWQKVHEDENDERFEGIEQIVVDEGQDLTLDAAVAGFRGERCTSAACWSRNRRQCHVLQVWESSRAKRCFVQLRTQTPQEREAVFVHRAAAT